MYNTDCDCVGPKNGEPFCYCMMKEKGIYESNGNWIDPSRDDKIISDVKKEDKSDE